jgi:hypothetical protein
MGEYQERQWRIGVRIILAGVDKRKPGWRDPRRKLAT